VARRAEVSVASVIGANPAVLVAKLDIADNQRYTSYLAPPVRRSELARGRVQSSLIPENFNTLAHLSVSISTKLANGAGP
jgi:hypothetical protein